MTAFTLLFAALVGLAFVLIFLGVKIVPQASVIVIERLGRYNKTLESGFNFILPFFDKPREIDMKKTRKMYDGRKISVTSKVTIIDLREAVHDFPRQNVITKDNVVIEMMPFFTTRSQIHIKQFMKFQIFPMQ